jgi:hypothetical protein
VRGSLAGRANALKLVTFPRSRVGPNSSVGNNAQKQVTKPAAEAAVPMSGGRIRKGSSAPFTSDALSPDNPAPLEPVTRLAPETRHNVLPPRAAATP